MKGNNHVTLATMDGVYHLMTPTNRFQYQSMKEHTFSRRFDQLVTLINIHPNRDELLRIMEEQVADDTELIAEAA